MSITATLYGNNIEAARCQKCGVALKKVLGAGKNARLFSGIDAFRAASEVGAVSKTHLDKGDDGAVTHYQIDLSVPATIVTLYQSQALVEQMPASDVFGPGAALNCALTSGVHCCIDLVSGSMIRGIPLLNRAHMSRRLIRLFSLSESAPVTPWNSA